MTKFFFSPLPFLEVFGSGIRDGQKIRIRDKHPGSVTLAVAFSYFVLYDTVPF
jgi:hypothetical protein